MTIKNISEITRLSRMTITRKIKEFYPELVQKGKTIDLDEQQSIKVMDDLRKKGFIVPAQNEHVPAQNEHVTKTDLKEFAQTIIKEMMQSIIPLIIQKPEQKQIPFKNQRAELNQKVRQFAKDHGYDFESVWNKLYSEFYYRYNINLRIRAKNEDLAPIEYAEKHDHLTDLINIVEEII